MKIEPSGGFCGRSLNVWGFFLLKDNFVSVGVIVDEVNGGCRLPRKEMCRGKK